MADVYTFNDLASLCECELYSSTHFIVNSVAIHNVGGSIVEYPSAAAKQFIMRSNWICLPRNGGSYLSDCDTSSDSSLLSELLYHAKDPIGAHIARRHHDLVDFELGVKAV